MTNLPYQTSDRNCRLLRSPPGDLVQDFHLFNFEIVDDFIPICYQEGNVFIGIIFDLKSFLPFTFYLFP